MSEILNYFVSKLGSFISFLDSVPIAGNVSFLSFCGALLVLMLIIHNLVLRAR